MTYFGNFCTGFISRLSNDNLRLCSRVIVSRNLANAGRAVLVVRIASFALFQLFTNDVYVSRTAAFENCNKVN